MFIFLSYFFSKRQTVRKKWKNIFLSKLNETACGSVGNKICNNVISIKVSTPEIREEKCDVTQMFTPP
jgi:hypothetical protein